MPHEADAPVLLCAGTDPDRAAALAERAVALLAARRAVVLSAWQPPEFHKPLEAVLDAWYDLHSEIEAQATARAEAVVERACAVLAAAGWDARPVVARDARPAWQVALTRADDAGAPVIVAGTRERVDGHPGSLGSQVRALAHRSRRPLLVLPPGAPIAGGAPAFFAFDGSATATAALEAATRVLIQRPAVVHTVWHAPTAVAPAALVAIPAAVAGASAARLDAAVRSVAEATAADGAERLAQAGWSASADAIESRTGDWQALVAAAEAHAAAVVVTGSRGRSRLAAALLGSVAEGLLRHAGRPVLVVRADEP